MAKQNGQARPAGGAGRKQRKAVAVDPGDQGGEPCRLRRIEGQVRGIHKMVEEDRYCADVLGQISAIHEALCAVGRELIRNHLRHCAADAIQAGGVSSGCDVRRACRPVSQERAVGSVERKGRPMQSTITLDPVCGMKVSPEKAAGHGEYEGKTYDFCSKGCLAKFEQDPGRYVEEPDDSRDGSRDRPAGPPPPDGALYTCPMHPEVRRITPAHVPNAGWRWSPSRQPHRSPGLSTPVPCTRRSCGTSRAIARSAGWPLNQGP